MSLSTTRIKNLAGSHFRFDIASIPRDKRLKYSKKTAHQPNYELSDRHAERAYIALDILPLKWDKEYKVEE